MSLLAWLSRKPAEPLSEASPQYFHLETMDRRIYSAADSSLRGIQLTIRKYPWRRPEGNKKGRFPDCVKTRCEQG